MEVINSIILVLLVLIVLFLRFYLPKYLSKKAENLAQKQDISEITSQIESIKHEFNKKNEEIRSNLAIITDKKIEYHKLVKDAVIKYNEAISIWYHVGLDMSNVIFMVNPEEIKQKLIEVNKYVADVWKARANLSLTIGSNDFVQNASHLFKDLMEYSHYIQRYLLQYYHSVQMKESLTNQVLLASTQSLERVPELQAKLDKKWQEIQDGYTKFSKEQSERMRKAYSSKMKFENDSYRFIKNELA